ncbi:hypothetical protein D6856_04840 [Butyrivibrio sp. XB500-5]|uniref:hypothetical protein n=1 Tax=Butyrivibrio sp. XB500-5 TaxID=2364880 RepID=UPI000EA9FD54|nr:hypothetical protein [Butyrivibrio sp. XB500-5]RKM61533.1 hypothetical protein D6856_04840 [Butyrivibrio sp. XB500-5]
MYLKQEYNCIPDPEFEALHIPASEKYTKNLENSILKSGISHPLIIWHGTLIDGYKRYKICKAHDIPFPVHSISLTNRFDAMEWVCDQMLLRKDLSEERRKYYIGKKFLFRLSSAKKSDLPTSIENDHPRLSNRRYDIAAAIGKPLNLSYGTVLKYSQYASALDSIRSRETTIFERIISGEVRISHESAVEISQLAGDDMRILRECFADKNRDHISHSEIWHELQWNRVHPTLPTSRKKKQTTAPIKQMPKYDPDAELSSLTLTIPSWIKSIERTVKNADFSAATIPAKHKLREQLRELSKAADYLYYYTQEAFHE